MNNIVVGVFPSGSEVSIEVSRALGFIRNIKLIGLASIKDYGSVAFPENYDNLPFYKDTNFIKELRKVVRHYGITFLIPGMDEVGYLLKSNEHEVGCEVVYASLNTAEILRKKSSTYKALAGVVPTPKMLEWEEISSSHLPIFTKPDVGYGSRGAQKIESIEEFLKLTLIQKETNIFTEYLPGTELTVDCFSEMNSDLLFAGPRVRERTRIGISVATKPIPLSTEIRNIAVAISKKLNMSGCWFFQLKQDVNNAYKVQEVAGRLSGSMAMYRLLGVNFILLDLYQRNGIEVSIPRLIGGEFRLERAFDVSLVGSICVDSVYVDLDDCLVLRNSINTKLISFLFACLNRSLPIYLVTRHAGDLSETLKAFRISQIFSEVYHLKNNEDKYTYIEHLNPLFIDDSFQERSSVRENIFGSTVMSPDMLDEGILK
ncbi:ATP-grasp domain-containing protein [Gammaproteobacteria bacterium]|nr:ATP-grasp domain-containing protein [Gammaproteobacteria bacterium]